MHKSKSILENRNRSGKKARVSVNYEELVLINETLCYLRRPIGN